MRIAGTGAGRYFAQVRPGAAQCEACGRIYSLANRYVMAEGLSEPGALIAHKCCGRILAVWPTPGVVQSADQSTEVSDMPKWEDMTLIELEKAAADLTTELFNVRVHLLDLQREVANLKNEIERLRTVAANKVQKESSAERRLGLAEISIEAREKLIDTLKTRLSQLETEVETRKALLAGAGAAQEEMRQRLIEQANELTDHRVDAKHHEQRVQTLHGEIDRLNGQVKRLVEERDTAKTERDMHAEAARDLRGDVRSAERGFDDARRLLDIRGRELKEARDRADRLGSSLQALIEDQSNTIAELRAIFAGTLSFAGTINEDRDNEVVGARDIRAQG